MTTKLVTRVLKTGELTATSNVTSVKVKGHQVSILEDQPKPGEKDTSSVHLTFDVEHPQKSPSLLATTEELGFIMDRDDAVNISLSLLAMAMENKTPAEIESIKTRLSSMIEELH